MSKNGYEDLEVWKLAIGLAKMIYNMTENFPQKEQYGLTNQIRRSAVSIASNIAEGSSRTKTDFARFVIMSIGSNAELKTQIIIAKEVGYLNGENFIKLSEVSDQIGRMLKGLQRSLKPNYEPLTTN